MTAKGQKIRNMVLSGLFAALMAVCAWIAIPLPGVSVTLQLFGVVLALGVLGGKAGCASILTYLLLGAWGLPVFSGFRGGAGVLLGPTGGFLLGFLALGLLYWLVTALFPRSRALAAALGLAVCYGFGAAWYQHTAGISWQAAVLACVVPYLVPDGIKVVLALALAGRLEGRIKR